MSGGTRTDEAKDPEFLSTLERGLRVLQVFGRDAPEMSLSDVAAASNLNPAVARRCLNTLAELGYVARHGRRFLLLPKLLKFADAFLASTNVEQAVMPALQNLRDETGDSVVMGVRVGEHVIGIAHGSPAHAIRPSGNIGTSFPLHATSLGKAILAHLAEQELAEYFANSHRVRLTPNTITDETALRAQLAEIRCVGFAASDGEYDHGVYAVAVPVWDEDRNVIGSINCSTANTRAARRDFEESRVPILRETASQIGREVRKHPVLFRSLRS